MELLAAVGHQHLDHVLEFELIRFVDGSLKLVQMEDNKVLKHLYFLHRLVVKYCLEERFIMFFIF